MQTIYKYIYEVFENNNITYKVISDTEVQVNRVSKEIAICTIPDFVYYDNKQYRVTSIGNRAFEDCKCLISITIPESVTSIKNDVFYGYSSLTSITLPASLTKKCAFINCFNLKSVKFYGKNNLENISDCAFENCHELSHTDDCEIHKQSVESLETK